MQRTDQATRNRDALHILPLTDMPLHTAGLRNARIVKNVRLDGVVELFSDQASGSGQIHPSELTKVFDFRDHNERDPDVVTRLCELPSYDVYSLRISLRQAGVEVERYESLKLSEEAQRELAPNMKSFTEPLMKAVFGSEMGEGKDLRDLIALSEKCSS